MDARNRSCAAPRGTEADLLTIVRYATKAFLLPPAGPLIVALAGVLLLRCAPRLGRTLALGGILVLFALSLPAVALLLARSFDAPLFEAKQHPGAQAIVVLGGGVNGWAPEFGGETVGRRSLERVRYAARVARETGLPVLVTGGAGPGSGTTEAAVMARTLAEDYGVPPRWVEARSRNTRENARNSAELLRADGLARVIVVAHAVDMPRAMAEFRDAGLEPAPAPTMLPWRGALTPVDFVPTAAALQLSHDALYEKLAYLARSFLEP